MLVSSPFTESIILQVVKLLQRSSVHSTCIQCSQPSSITSPIKTHRIRLPRLVINLKFRVILPRNFLPTNPLLSTRRAGTTTSTSPPRATSTSSTASRCCASTSSTCGFTSWYHDLLPGSECFVTRRSFFCVACPSWREVYLVMELFGKHSTIDRILLWGWDLGILFPCARIAINIGLLKNLGRARMIDGLG